jgi:hypothetical protein
VINKVEAAMSEASGSEGAAALDEQVAPGEQTDQPSVPEQTPVVDLSKTGPASAASTQTHEASEPITFQSMADRLTLGLLASIIGAVLVFVSAFLTWASVHAKSSVGGTVSGATTDSLGIAGSRLGLATLVLSITALALCGVMLLPATKVWAWKLLAGSGLLVALLAIIELIQIPGTLRPSEFICPTGLTCTFHRSIGPGVWFTLVAGILVAAGAYVHHIRPVHFRTQLAGVSTAKPATATETAEPAPVPVARPLPSPGPSVKPLDHETLE